MGALRVRGLLCHLRYSQEVGGGLCNGQDPQGTHGGMCGGWAIFQLGETSYQAENPRVLRREPSIVGPRPEERCGQSAVTGRMTLGSEHSVRRPWP